MGAQKRKLIFHLIAINGLLNREFVLDQTNAGGLKQSKEDYALQWQ